MNVADGHGEEEVAMAAEIIRGSELCNGSPRFPEKRASFPEDGDSIVGRVDHEAVRRRMSARHTENILSFQRAAEGSDCSLDSDLRSLGERIVW
jgi:hypothetical protein